MDHSMKVPIGDSVSKQLCGGHGFGERIAQNEFLSRLTGMSHEPSEPRTPVPNAPADYVALRTNAAYVESPRTGWLRVSGEDRLRFTNGLVTCDLRTLESGNGSYGFFTDPKGKVLADGAFLAVGPDLWIETPRAAESAIAEHMSKYLVADRVEIEVLSDWRTILVAGPKAPEPLAAEFDRLPAAQPWSGSVQGETEGDPVVIRAERRLGVPAWTIGGRPEAVSAIESSLADAGLKQASAEAVDSVRIEEGVPWFGADFGPDTEGGGSFPQETGLEAWAVSFEKGCYLGQEVIARIHFRGKVNRSLRGLVFEPGIKPRSGARLLRQDEPVGVMNSVAPSPLLGCSIGLAIVHHKAASGSLLETESGSCRLVELPFDAAGVTAPAE